MVWGMVEPLGDFLAKVHVADALIVSLCIVVSLAKDLREVKVSSILSGVSASMP